MLEIKSLQGYKFAIGLVSLHLLTGAMITSKESGFNFEKEVEQILEKMQSYHKNMIENTTKDNVEIQLEFLQITLCSRMSPEILLVATSEYKARNKEEVDKLLASVSPN